MAEYSNAVISCKVVDSYDYDTHTMFVADVTEAVVLSNVPSTTYQYYFDHIKPQPQPTTDKKGFVCKICGYIYEGDTLRTILSAPCASTEQRTLSLLDENGSTGAEKSSASRYKSNTPQQAGGA